MAFLGGPAFTFMTPQSSPSTWLPAATLYYVKSGDGLVFNDDHTLLPGSILTTYSQQISLGANGAELFFGSNPTGSPLTSPAAIGTDSATGTATATTSLAPVTTSVTASISASATSTPSTLYTTNSISTSGPSSPATSAHSHKATVSAGGAAGIGIGCAIAGAAIGFLLFWSFKRKSNNRHQTPDQEARATAFPRQEKQPVVNVQPLDNANLTTRTVENNLPQPLEDNAIAEAISKISNSIKNHVQSYYHSARVSAGAVNLDALQALGDGLPTSIGTLNTMLANPTTRETALRLCIAWVVVSRIQFGGDPRITFLPPEVTSCINSMTGLDNKPQGK